MKRIIILILVMIPFLGYGQLKQVQRGALNNSRAEHAINAGIDQTNTNTAGIATNASAISDISVGAFDTTNIVARLDTDSARTDANDAKITNATHSGEVTGSGALTIADDVIEAANLEATNSPTDNYIPSYDLATLGFTWVANEAGSGGDMSYTDTTAMLAPYIHVADTATMLSNFWDWKLGEGEPGLTVANNLSDLDNAASALGNLDITATAAEVSFTTDVTGLIQGQLDDKAPLASPTFTGTVNGAAITATGNITGAMATTLYTAATESLTAQECRNQGHVNNDADAIDFTLPTAVAGMVVLFYDFGGGVITVDAAAGDIITLSGTALDAGDAIDSPGDVGDFIALWAIDATNWVSVGASGTWVDGGTD